MGRSRRFNSLGQRTVRLSQAADNDLHEVAQHLGLTRHLPPELPRGDHEASSRLSRYDVRGAWLIVKEGHFTEELPLAQGCERAIRPAYSDLPVEDQEESNPLLSIRYDTLARGVRSFVPAGRERSELAYGQVRK